MIGKTVSHYEVVQKIGQGGMGVVYEARDLKLPRSVALKFLPPHMSADERAKKRFLHEAHAISALDHPNISVIHEIEESDDGHLFIVMPYYRGKTLKQVMQEGPIAIDTAVDVTAQTGAGLAKAHETGIVHRDIKPGNILVTNDGLVKILDFGLAMLEDSTRITREGVTVGTVAYMSPEQATGGDIDHRTDIWSLGVLLFEMLTQQLPFRGDIDQAMIYSMLNEEPKDLMGLRADTPAAVAAAVGRALQKDPAARFAHMGEFLGELGVTSPSYSIPATPVDATSDAPSIVVLPFDDLSPDKGNEYFSDGLTDEIITDLSQVKAVRVISRNSAVMLKGTTKGVRAISAELNVRYVLQGSVRKAGNNLRVHAHLVDSLSDTNVWANKFAGTMDDIFEIQEQVSRSIVDALNLHLTPRENELVAARPIENVQAYECYLRARQQIYLWSDDALKHALELLQTGLDIVGENALLYAGMAQVHLQYVNAGLRGPEALARAEEYTDKVLALEPRSAHGRRLMGMITFLHKRYQDAVPEFKQALATQPNDADSMFWLVAIYLFAGKMDEGEEMATRLLRIDPLNPINRTGPGWVSFFQGHFNTARTTFREVYESQPENPAHAYAYVQVLAHSHHLKDAYAVIERMEADSPEHPFTLMCVLLKHALQGKKSRADKVMTPELSAMLRSDLQYAWFVATCYALLNQTDKAIDWIEAAVDLGFINYPFLLEHERLLDNIRSDARFAELLERAKGEWERFVA